MAIFGPYPAVILDVHDGDTMRVDLDLGFGVHLTSLSCRVYGINAPELSADAGKIARDYAKTLLPVGTRVMITSHGFDKYGGRFDGEIKLEDGTNFGVKMIDTAHAVPFMISG